MSSMSYSSKDREYMRLALQLALQGRGCTRPNPLVGCVIVKRGKIVGTGYHRRYGGSHAEVNALRHAGSLAKDADVYLTLDPCRHVGNTPKCTDAFIRCGVRRVFSATLDPHDPDHEAESILTRHGISFSRGLLEEEAKLMNQIFFKNATLHLPYVTVKMATTLDGKIATASGFSRGITCIQSLHEVHRMRSRVDAILAGSGTVLADNPHLGVRYGKARGHDPLRVVLDSTLQIPLSAAIFRDRHVLVIATNRAPSSKLRAFTKHGIDVYNAGSSISLRKILDVLFQRGVYSLLVEAGSTLVTSLLREKLVDRYVQFIAPTLLGGEHSPTPFEGKDSRDFRSLFHLRNVSFRQFGDDVAIDGLLTIY